MQWSAIDSLNQRLPSSIRVFEGVDRRWPLKAWYVKADLSSPTVRAEIVMSDEVDATETVSSLARDLKACVVTNGGYFRMDLDPARHVGLLKVDTGIVHWPTQSVLREETRYPVARAALGFDSTGAVDIGWVTAIDSLLMEWHSPPPNLPNHPVGDSLIQDSLTEWPVMGALSAGPALISNGKIHITDNEEVFFGSSIPKVHPRTAAGVTSDGSLILLVVDGRQMASSGVDLEDLASILLALGAVEALNLDGGGSSTLVVDGVRLNIPAGDNSEREVMSAIALWCTP